MPRQVDLDMIELIDNKLTVDEYLKLRALVGWKKLSREQAQKALDNSLLVVGAYLQDSQLAWDAWWETVQSSATCRILSFRRRRKGMESDHLFFQD